MLQALGGEMANHLTHEELDRLYQLNDQGYFQKEVSEIICREFNRETMDRTTIYRRLKQRTKKKEVSAFTPSFCGRGHHLWVVESIVSTTTIPGPGGKGAAGSMLNSGVRRSCRDCGRIEETTRVAGIDERVIPPRTGRLTPCVGEHP